MRCASTYCCRQRSFICDRRFVTSCWEIIRISPGLKSAGGTCPRGWLFPTFLELARAILAAAHDRYRGVRAESFTIFVQPLLEGGTLAPPGPIFPALIAAYFLAFDESSQHHFHIRKA